MTDMLFSFSFPDVYIKLDNSNDLLFYLKSNQVNQKIIKETSI